MVFEACIANGKEVLVIRDKPVALHGDNRQSVLILRSNLLKTTTGENSNSFKKREWLI